MIHRSVLFLSLLPFVADAVRGSSEPNSKEVRVSADDWNEQITLNVNSARHVQEALAVANETVPIEDLSEELYFGLDMGVPQTLYDNFEDEQVDRIVQARTYLQQEIWVHGPNMCSNRMDACSYYAVVGECERNPAFMKQNCAPMCQMCNPNEGHVHHHMGVPTPPQANCPVDYESNAWAPGDLNKMFERILAEPAFQKHEPKVVSRPTLAPGDTAETADYVVGGPWMIVFDKFVTDEEADRLVELGGLEGYQRSLSANTLLNGAVAREVSPTRTSSNAWCKYTSVRGRL